jgi:hypothetical protein
LARKSLDLHDDFENCRAADDEDEEREKNWTDWRFSFIAFFLQNYSKKLSLKKLTYEACWNVSSLENFFLVDLICSAHSSSTSHFLLFFYLKNKNGTTSGTDQFSQIQSVCSK